MRWFFLGTGLWFFSLFGTGFRGRGRVLGARATLTTPFFTASPLRLLARAHQAPVPVGPGKHGDTSRCVTAHAVFGVSSTIGGVDLAALRHRDPFFDQPRRALSGWAASRHPRPPFGCRDRAQTLRPGSDPPVGPPHGTLRPRLAAVIGPKRHCGARICRLGRLTAR